ncbi:MAG: TolC family protein [Gemmatales bacterium]|nr:TolC family protein [Gemmatales bacterium]MDW8386031.1 TolC family protein [Gemmatales bacterium]
MRSDLPDGGSVAAVDHREGHSSSEGGDAVAAGVRSEEPGTDIPPPRMLSPDDAPSGQAPNAVTLDQVINATLLADPRLRAGFEAINQAYGEALQASLRPNPTFSIAQTLLPLTRPFTVDAQGGPPQLDVGISYPIDWFVFGKRAAAMQAALLNVRVSEAEFADLVRQRVVEAATAYYDVLEAKSLLELARQDAANFRQVEAITQRAVEGGGRPKVELGRVRLDRLRAEQSVRDAENALVAAKARLRAVMGLGDFDPSFDVSGTLDEITVPDLPTVEEAFGIAVENRPDIAALQWRIQQSRAQMLVEKRQAFPEVVPQIGYTRQFQRKAIGFPDANSWGVGLEVGLPLFDRNQGNRYRAASVAVQQQLELQAGLVELRAEVIEADQNLRTALANARAVAEQQLTLANEVRNSLNRAYEEGGRPLIDVLDAQRNFRETYRLFIESRANLGRAAVRYNAVLGKRVTP